MALPDFGSALLSSDPNPVTAAEPALAAADPAAPAEEAVGPWETPEGIAVPPLFTSADLAPVDFLDTYPGIAPYLRGPYPAMYATQPWTIRQYAGFSTA
ncbi:MAG: mutB, partial [Frankiales bacterium]|nr:mutB [Frankiales bacterium]